jgi:hypothetical protein
MPGVSAFPGAACHFCSEPALQLVQRCDYCQLIKRKGPISIFFKGSSIVFLTFLALRSNSSSQLLSYPRFDLTGPV